MKVRWKRVHHDSKGGELTGTRMRIEGTAEEKIGSIVVVLTGDQYGKGEW